MNTLLFEHSTAVNVVTSSLREVFDILEEAGPEVIDESTVIVGDGAVLDSLGVVSLIVEIEQRLESDYEVVITLASERAMSQRSSPFRTVGVLADYATAMVHETAYEPV